MSNQQDLLKKLSISDDERTQGGGLFRVPRRLMLASLLIVVAGGLYWFWPSLNGGEPPGAPLTADSSERPRDNAKDGAASPGARADLTAPPEQPSSLQVGAPERGRDGVVLDASGYVTARQIATVSAELTGLITEVLIEEGMRVESGQVLARLDAAIARADHNVALARVRQSEAEVLTVSANLAEAERELSRATQLRRDEFASEARVTQAGANVDALRANLESARARVEVNRFEAERLKERLADHTIRAPFSGVVTVKAAQPGEIVSPVSAGGGFTRTGICTIVDMSSLEIEVDVNEAFIGRIRENQKVIANLDAYPDWDIDAYVIAIIPTANRDKATVRVRVGLRDRDPRVLPDMGVRVAFTNETVDT